MGTPFIRIMSYANKSNIEVSRWRTEAVRRLRELTKMAEQGGVTLVHENCTGWGGLGPQQTLDMLAEIESPALQLVFDTGNPVQHEQDAWDYFIRCRKHIVYVHIKDANRTVDGKTLHCFPGEGKGAVRRIIKELSASGYNGGLSIEPHISSVIHEGKEAIPEEFYQSYVEYGRRLMKIVEETRVQQP